VSQALVDKRDSCFFFYLVNGVHCPFKTHLAHGRMTSDSDSSIAPIEHLTIVAAPGLFVILWASGFIGAKLGLPFAEPLTFLFLRMFGAVLLLGIIVLVARPKWPTREGILDSCATGVFMHALYLGGVYISIANGLPAALSALIVDFNPYSPQP
jgi:EamA-like transporter family